MFENVIFWAIIVLFSIHFFKHWKLFRLFYSIEHKAFNAHSIQMFLTVLGLYLSFKYDRSIWILIGFALVCSVLLQLKNAHEQNRKGKQ
jgi:hypothetical protein